MRWGQQIEVVVDNYSYYLSNTREIHDLEDFQDKLKEQYAMNCSLRL